MSNGSTHGNQEFIFPNQLENLEAEDSEEELEEVEEIAEAPPSASMTVTETLLRRAELQSQAALLLEQDIASWSSAEAQAPGTQDTNSLTRIAILREGHLTRRDILQAAAAEREMLESLSLAIANLSNVIAQVAGVLSK